MTTIIVIIVKITIIINITTIINIINISIITSTTLTQCPPADIQCCRRSRFYSRLLQKGRLEIKVFVKV